ncbi:hypothetical protein PV327_006086 [Microctonus hyperodae]|uniref:Uncharacterized protein n=1 Tax=Microctonus hyperodae TaxID=165561 RepID=A0AA39L0F1_MICHY|nr:hypothetical protein PV327_006086 [Microctonus hyperodae]
MKAFFAIACLAFIACAESSTDVPHSLIGNVWRFKGGLANNIGEMSDRVVDRVRNLSPLRLLNINFNAATASKPISRPAAVGQAPAPAAAAQAPAPAAASPPKPASNPTTASPPPAVSSTTSKPVNCTEKEALKKKLQLAQKHENEAAVAKNEAVEAEKAAAGTLKTTPNNLSAQENQKKSKSEILVQQTKEESAHLLVNDLLKKLAAYGSCP